MTKHGELPVVGPKALRAMAEELEKLSGRFTDPSPFYIAAALYHLAAAVSEHRQGDPR